MNKKCFFLVFILVTPVSANAGAFAKFFTEIIDYGVSLFNKVPEPSSEAANELLDYSISTGSRIINRSQSHSKDDENTEDTEIPKLSDKVLQQLQTNPQKKFDEIFLTQ